MRKPITFDTVVRGLLIAAGATGAFFLLRALSDVLLPFFVAWLLAYLIYPMVTFFQYRLHLRYRVPCIVLSLAVILSILTGLVILIVPPTIQEFASLKGEIVSAIQQFGESPVALQIEEYISNNLDENTISKLVQNKDVLDMLGMGASKLWDFTTDAFNLLAGIVSSLLIVLYLFFILMDYEQIATGFVNLVPNGQRTIATKIAEDVKNGMSAYFRGQAMIALIVGILFSIGFSIIGLPMAVGLGMFIGLLNLVPYLQTIGILPACLLAFLHSMQTGESFWLIILYCFIVFLVVQGIQDIILTPRIMGKMMGLKPAIILLSLSVWGALLGFIGLIIALPLTTILISWYKFWVLKMDIGERISKEVHKESISEAREESTSEAREESTREGREESTREE